MLLVSLVLWTLWMGGMMTDVMMGGLTHLLGIVALAIVVTRKPRRPRSTLHA